MNEPWAARLYLLNFALLFTHQIDAAYWEEWRLFRIPGGIQVFLVLNFLLLLVCLVGFAAVLQRRSSAPVFSLILAVAGVFAFVIHISFLVVGHPQFRLPASLAVLGATLVVSAAQAWIALGNLVIQLDQGGYHPYRGHRAG